MPFSVVLSFTLLFASARGHLLTFFVDVHKTIELLNGVLHLFNQIEEIESMIVSNDFSEFLTGYDKLKEAITFLEQNSGGVGAAEKLEKCKGSRKLSLIELMRRLALHSVAKVNLSKKFKEVLEKNSLPQSVESVVERHNSGEAWPETIDFLTPKVRLISSRIFVVVLVVVILPSSSPLLSPL